MADVAATIGVSQACAFVAACFAALIVASRNPAPVAGLPFAPALVATSLMTVVGVGF